MLGFFRYFLALSVAISHLFSESTYWQGSYAVFCFYLISGYLMTYILTVVYVGRQGVKSYLLNRLLRIYPVYFVVLALSLLVAMLFPAVQTEPTGAGLKFSQVMTIPQSAGEWFSNITLMYPWDSHLQISQAWSIKVELVFYGLMPFIATRLWTVVPWFAASLAIVVYMEMSGDLFPARYTTVTGASIAFSLGALIYHYKDHFKLPGWHVLIAATLFLGHLWLAPDLWDFPRTNTQGFVWFFKPFHYGLYANLACGAYLLLAIVLVEKPWDALEKIGQYLGNLAYPIFLVHWAMAATVTGLGFSSSETLAYLTLSILLIHLVAVFLHTQVERPINERLRDKIRVAAHG